MNTLTKYPKTLSGIQCVAPCYKKGSVVTHPFYFTAESINDFNFCPTAQYVDKITKQIMRSGICMNVTANIEEHNKILATNININFDGDIFLQVYYNINSFADMVDWINDNPTEPYLTKIRLFNITLKYYGKNTEIIDQRLLAFLLEVCKKNVKIFYHELNTYIGKVYNNIMLVKPNNNNLEFSELYQERINYIISGLMKTNDLYKFLVIYLKEYDGEKWENIDNYIPDICVQFAFYLKNKIIKILETNLK